MNIDSKQIIFGLDTTPMRPFNANFPVIKSSLWIIFLISIIFSNNLFAANSIDGKTLIFFNHLNEGRELTPSRYIPFIGQDIYGVGDEQSMSPTGMVLTELPYPDNWYSHTFGGNTISGASSYNIIVNLPGSGGFTTQVEGPKESAWEGLDTLYAIYDSSGDSLHYMTQKPRIIFFLNPWSDSAPSISINSGAFKKMYREPSMCGWYFSIIGSGSSFNVVFEDFNFGQSYGLNGLDNSIPINIDTYFNSNSTVFITPRPLPSGGPELSKTYPIDNPIGFCNYKLAATIRDFNSSHPDFGNACGLTTGMVKPTLDADGKPEAYNTWTCNNSQLHNWFRDNESDPNPSLRNKKTCVDLEMGKALNGQWEINSEYSTHMGFWPIDTVFVNDQIQLYDGGFSNSDWSRVVSANDPIPGQTETIGQHNFFFCMETHAQFKYRAGQEFTFRGDDDVWVYIDGRLVVDLGGVHLPTTGGVDLDTLNLTVGEEYDFDLFYCERMPGGSNLMINTSIYFEQQRGLFTETISEQNGVKTYQVRKVVQSDESCAGRETSGSQIIDEPEIEFILRGRNLDSTLESGLNYGGINIEYPNQYSIDKEAITGLSPGVYSLFVQDLNDPSVNMTIVFRVPGEISIQNPEKISVLAGTHSVPLIIESFKENAGSNQSSNYYLRIPEGVQVYNDSLMTELTDLNTLQTNTDGLDTLWVFSDRSADTTFTHTISIVDGDGLPKEITFEIPQIRFIDQNGNPLNSFNLGKWAYVANQVFAQLYWSGGECIECMGDSIFFNNTDTLSFKPSSDGAEVDWVLVDSNGRIEFYVVASMEISNYEFTIRAKSQSTQATYKDITLLEPPFPLVQRSIVFDTDGDGIADQLRVEYNRPIKDSLPITFSYFWPENNQKNVIAPENISQYLLDDSTLIIDGDLTDSIHTYGKGSLNSTYRYEGEDIPTIINVKDGVGPIISQAIISIDNNTDFLQLFFSEAIDTTILTQDEDWYEFFKTSYQLQLTELEYEKGRFLREQSSQVLLFRSDTEDTYRAVAGDSVRFYYEVGSSGGLRDLEGNAPHHDGRFVQINGESRLEIITNPVIITQNPNDHSDPGTISIEGVPLGTGLNEVIKERNQGGVMVPFEIFTQYLRDDSYDDIKLEISQFIYTNLGGYVLSQDLTINCQSEIFNGDCRELSNQRDLFVSWNYKDAKGRSVGTGVYLIKTFVEVHTLSQGQSRYLSRNKLDVLENRPFRREVD